MSRLTEEIWKGKYTYAGKPKSTKEHDLWVDEAIQKLGKLEDLMQSYNVEDLEELDKLLEMATAYEELTKQLGCPLEVLVKMWKNHKYYAEKPNHKGKLYIMDFPNISFVIKGGKVGDMEYQDNSFILGGTCYDFYNRKRQEFEGWDVHLKDYKKTWWLKEDKSE